jgi:hypothetical protein
MSTDTYKIHCSKFYLYNIDNDKNSGIKKLTIVCATIVIYTYIYIYNYRNSYIYIYVYIVQNSCLHPNIYRTLSFLTHEYSPFKLEL